MTNTIRLAKTSAQRRALLHQDGSGRLYFGLRRRFVLPEHPSDRFHVVTEQDNLPILAFDYLGDTRLEWVIADLNGVTNFMTLEPGTTLRIPARERLTPEVLRAP